MADLIEEIGHLDVGSPLWTNLELLQLFQGKLPHIFGNKKGHAFFGHGFENLAPRSGRY